MTKTEFLAQLREGLIGLPNNDIEERLSFYGEMIDDRIDEGVSEEDAVHEIGNVDKVISQIIADTPLSKLVKEKMKPKKRLHAWEITLIVLGSPIWISLMVAAFTIILSLYAVLWSVLISLWATLACVAACVFGFIAAGIVFCFSGKALSGTAMIGAGIACAGFFIFLFFGCTAATKGILLLTKKICFCVKKCFVKKEEA